MITFILTTQAQIYLQLNLTYIVLNVKHYFQQICRALYINYYKLPRVKQRLIYNGRKPSPPVRVQKSFLGNTSRSLCERCEVRFFGRLCKQISYKAVKQALYGNAFIPFCRKAQACSLLSAQRHIRALLPLCPLSFQ